MSIENALPPSKPLIHSTIPGQTIPVLGLGVYQSTKTYPSVLAALKHNYRHFDTAQIYWNEAATGQAILEFLAANPSVSRSDIFICTKLWELDLSGEKPSSFVSTPENTSYTVQGAIDGFNHSLSNLGTDLEYVDLYLLHNPRPGPEARLQAWLGLQETVKSGKCKALGVSNFSKKHIEELVNHPEVHVHPAVNQIEFHPWCQHRELVKYCNEKGILIVAYSPLTQGTRLGDPLIVELAAKYGKTPAQVVLRWCLQQGVVIIPKSDREERIQENAALWDFQLEDADVEKITALDEGISGKLGEWDPDAWE